MTQPDTAADAPRSTLRVALVQLTSGLDAAENMKRVESLIAEAASGGAELVSLPEVVNLMQRRRKLAQPQTATEAADATLAAWREQARSAGIWLHVGSMVLALDDDERFANRSLLIAPDGSIRARYDKIHMFDVDLAGGESYRESDGFRPGTRAVLADTPWGGFGMSVCYDVRFPHLYRQLAQAGARILAVPAAFTRTTGQAHWHTLLRARAIETGCFVIAAAQCGDHADGRKTYGHSLVVSPWGEVLADGGSEPTIVHASLDLGAVGRARAMVPAWNRNRPFAAP